MSSDKPPIEGQYTVVGETERPTQGAREPIIKSWKGLIAFVVFFLINVAAALQRHH